LVTPKFVMPVKTGIHVSSKNLDTGLRRYDDRKVSFRLGDVRWDLL
jgi:hypothetical protein